MSGLRIMKCVACNNTRSTQVDETLEGDALEMFNFVCCLQITEPDESQGICKECNEELRVSFNFKKRCLEIFANVFNPGLTDDENHEVDDEDENFEGISSHFMFDSLLDQTLDEGENSLNLDDLALPSASTVSTVLSALDVSDSSKCRYCFVKFSSKEACLEHMESHKGDDKPYKCPQEGCNSSFKARKNLKDHYLVHSNERPFPCHFCDQTFKSSSNRSKHERRIHLKERKALREASPKVGKAPPEAKLSHVSVKIKQEPLTSTEPANCSQDDEERIFKCDYEGCRASFKSRSSLKDHKKVHSDLRPYQCAFCSSAFKSSSNRSKHERGSHYEQYSKRKHDRERSRNNDTEQGPPLKKIKIERVDSLHAIKVIKKEVVSPKKTIDFPCRYCDRVFAKSESRRRHETTHAEVNAFDCGFCSMNFKTQEALKEHTKTHTLPARLSCSFPGCDEVYLDRRSLKEHESHHDHEAYQLQPVEYHCEEEDCGKVYTSPKALRNHKKMKHNDNENEEISCDICLNSFRRSEIAEHLRVHI